jgi:hemerythrin-like domain-containing protein
MTGSQTFPHLTRRILDEHQEIAFYLDQLERSLQGLGDAEGDLDSLRRIAAQIVGLRERLDEHFASEEEEGGLFVAIEAMLPEERNTLRVLLGHHQRVREMLELVRFRAQYGETRETPLLRDELTALLAGLREHERREEALLERVLQRIV